MALSVARNAATATEIDTTTEEAATSTEEIEDTTSTIGITTTPIAAGAETQFTGEMRMQMDSSAVNDPKVVSATRKVIADSAGVQESSTEVTLSLARRQLQESVRRLALADIKALYAITIPSNSPGVSGATVAATLSATSSSSLTSALTSALQAAGANYTVQVSSLTATVQQVRSSTTEAPPQRPEPQIGRAHV